MQNNYKKCNGESWQRDLLIKMQHYKAVSLKRQLGDFRHCNGSGLSLRVSLSSADARSILSSLSERYALAESLLMSKNLMMGFGCETM